MANLTPHLKAPLSSLSAFSGPSTHHSLLSRISSHIAFAQGSSTVKSRSLKGSKPGQTTRGRQTAGGRQNSGGRQTGRGKKGPGGGSEESRNASTGSQFYFNFTGFPFPLGPIFKRPTVRTEVERGRIWLFEQQQALAFSNVMTNIRMTVIRLSSGGLWVHAPIAPTQECVRLVKELGHPVEYIILPTFAYEHKVFVGPFSRKFPNAEVYTAPRQWSWPIPLPPQAFGIFSKGTLMDDDESTPWAADIKQKVFSSSVGFGPYSEVAFLHPASQTLICTDAVIQVPSTPPEVIPEWALENSGKRVPFPINVVCKGENEGGPTPPENREDLLSLGWMRMVLLILYFVPFDLLTPEEGFDAISDKLFVSPVVRTLVFTKANRAEVRSWVESISSDWSFKQIIPAHFDAPIAATAADFREAFSFLFADQPPKRSPGFLARLFRGGPPSGRVLTEFPDQDMRGLRGLETGLQKTKVINPDEAN